MQVTKENKDDLNAVIRIVVDKQDYEKEVNDKLKDYKRKANMPGFRPGMVPIGMIKRMYYKPILLEEINRLVSENLTKFIDNEKLNILGEPLTSKEEQKEIDFDTQESFEFVFDIGIAPEVEADITSKDKLPYYVIDANKKLIDKHADSYTSQYGEMTEGEEVQEEDVVKGRLSQLTPEGEVIEGGITVENASLSMKVVKDEEVKKQLTGAKVGDVLQIDLKKAYPSEAELTRMLNISKEQVESESMLFQLTIEEISRWKKAEINQDFFDKAFGEGEVTSEEEFRNRLKEEIEKAYAQNSDFKLFLDAREKLVSKFKAELPEEFIRRWLLESNEGKLSEEDIDKDFEKVRDDLKWQLIQDALIKKYELKVEPEEIEQLARQQVLMQFRQYGMANVPEEHLNNYAAEMLKKDQERRRLYEQRFQEKITQLVKETVKLEEKKVKDEDFSKLFDKK
ncbi:MAG: trigger factor [Marinilabiliales bacterium]|nr:MAG: trigger factor [Marinilabiliales bacterium]